MCTRAAGVCASKYTPEVVCAGNHAAAAAAAPQAAGCVCIMFVCGVCSCAWPHACTRHVHVWHPSLTLHPFPGGVTCDCSAQPIVSGTRQTLLLPNPDGIATPANQQLTVHWHAALPLMSLKTSGNDRQPARLPLHAQPTAACSWINCFTHMQLLLAEAWWPCPYPSLLTAPHSLLLAHHPKVWSAVFAA